MNVLHVTLVYVVWFLVTFFFLVSALTFLKHRQQFYVIPPSTEGTPFVSIVVPAFNEEAGIADTIESLLEIDYPKNKLEIIVVNDGSKDRTSEIAGKYAAEDKIVLINNEKNMGKAASLNFGFEKARGKYVACIDADTVTQKDVIKKTINYFKDEDVAAVIVRITVRNPKNWLEKIIAVEYNLGLGFYPKIFSSIDCMYLTPGQFSIYRRDKVLAIGGFQVGNIVEDLEIAYRFQKAHYKIACCVMTGASTKVPNNLRDLYHQRKRWYSGTIQTLLQHRDVFFNRNLGNFGLFFIPFNYGTTALGLLLFFSTTYLFFSNAHMVYSDLSLINFDIFPSIKNFITHMALDPLSIGMLSLLAVTPFVMNLMACYVGMKMMGEKIRKNLFGFVAFLFFFLPYHVFWIIALYFVVLKKKVRWRASM